MKVTGHPKSFKFWDGDYVDYTDRACVGGWQRNARIVGTPELKRILIRGLGYERRIFYTVTFGVKGRFGLLTYSVESSRIRSALNPHID